MRSINANNGTAANSSSSSFRGWMSEQTWMFILILIAFMFFAIVVAFIAKQIVDWLCGDCESAGAWWQMVLMFIYVALVISIDVVTAGDLAAITSWLTLACHQRQAEQHVSFLPLSDDRRLHRLVLFLAAVFSCKVATVTYSFTHSTNVLCTGHSCFPFLFVVNIICTSCCSRGAVNHNWIFVDFTLMSYATVS